MDVQDKAEKAMKKAYDVASDKGEEVVKSGKDWMNYIQEHPLQSILFGIIGYFALKGMIKD